MAVLPGITASSSVNGSQVLEKVYQGRQTYEFREGFNIPLHPHDVWIVCRGVVQLNTFHRDGNEAILGLVYPDMPFGAPLTQVDPYEAIGLTNVVLMRVSQQEIERSLHLSQWMLVQLQRRLQQTEAFLALNSQRRVGDRLQQLLLLLTKDVGEVIPEGMRLKVRFTHQQLAELVGTTRISVTRILGSFRKEGWLSIDGTRHFVIHESAVVDLQ